MALTRVLIVDDHALVRRSLRALLKTAPDIEVVGEASNGEEAIDLATSLRPNLILMDISMPRMDGLTATEQIKGLSKPPHVLILSMFADGALTLRAFKIGAEGVLLKIHASEEVLTAIRQVTQGHRVLSAELKALPALRKLLDADIKSVPG